MLAFEYAVAAGVDVLELDLAVTRDSVLVVSHDPVLSEALCTGGTGTRVIREMTFADLQRWDCGSLRNPVFPQQQTRPGTRVPRLEEVLGLAGRGRFGFNIETKISKDRPELAPDAETFARLLVEAVRRHGLENRVMIQSFDFRTLEAARRLAPEIRRAALYSGPKRELVAMAREAGASILSPRLELVTAEVVAAAHEAGLEVVPWTANNEAEWSRLAAAGVDAMITDDPAGLIAWLRSRGLR